MTSLFLFFFPLELKTHLYCYKVT